jgi:hypothetical protein
MNLYTEEGIMQAIEIAKRASHASALTILSASATVEEVEKMMPTIKLITDLFVSNFKSVLYEGRGGRPSVRKER